MLDPVGIEVLQLDLVVVQQPLEERMRADREPMLMEGHEGDDVTVGRHRHLMAGNQQLHRVGPPAKKTVLDEALYARVGDVRVIPRLHGRQGWKNESYAGGGRTKAMDPNVGGEEAEKARLRLGVSKDEGKGHYL